MLFDSADHVFNIVCSLALYSQYIERQGIEGRQAIEGSGAFYILGRTTNAKASLDIYEEADSDGS